MQHGEHVLWCEKQAEKLKEEKKPQGAIGNNRFAVLAGDCKSDESSEKGAGGSDAVKHDEHGLLRALVKCNEKGGEASVIRRRDSGLRESGVVMGVEVDSAEKKCDVEKHCRSEPSSGRVVPIE